MKRLTLLAAVACCVPTALTAQWVTRDRYPPKALREHREGTTEVAIVVDQQGRPAECKIATSSGSSDLDEAACEMISRRGHWSPALNEQGQSIASTILMKFVWKIPR